MASTGTQLCFKELAGKYAPRKPDETVLYQAVARNFRTFEALAEAEGKRIPKHITEEFNAFLRCGALAHGFLRLRCEDCKFEKLVAFSCKKRGFCPFPPHPAPGQCCGTGGKQKLLLCFMWWQAHGRERSAPR